MEGIPERILQTHPELAGVERALAAWRAGEPEPVPCTVCGKPLSVVRIEAAGTTLVRCPTGCTDYRTRSS